MSQLFKRACERLARVPTYYSTEQLKAVIKTEKFYGIKPEQVLENESNKASLIAVLTELGFKGRHLARFSQITRNAKTQYNMTGWKYTEEFLDSQRLNGGEFYSLIVELGEKPLYRKSTVLTAKKAVKKLVGSCPAFWKVERRNTEKSLIHVHVMVLAPVGHRFPRRVNNFLVLAQRLGEKEKYQGKTEFENVRDFISYLYKPADAREQFSIKENAYQMFYEWWQEQLSATKGKPKWESVILRGTFNLSISWLKDYTREEIEARYSISESSYSEDELSMLLDDRKPILVERRKILGDITMFLFGQRSLIVNSIPP